METKPLAHWVVAYLLRYGPTQKSTLIDMLVSDIYDMTAALNVITQYSRKHKVELLKYDADAGGWYVYDPQAARTYLDRKPFEVGRYALSVWVRTTAGSFFAGELAAGTRAEAYTLGFAKAAALEETGNSPLSVQLIFTLPDGHTRKEIRGYKTNAGAKPREPRLAHGPNLRRQRFKYEFVETSLFHAHVWDDLIRNWEEVHVDA